MMLGRRRKVWSETNMTAEFSVTLKEATVPSDSMYRQRTKQFVEETISLVCLISIHCADISGTMAIILRG